MRKRYTLTREQHANLLKASGPVPLIMLQCGMPPSPQERANHAWGQLGRELGFKHMTVRPVEGSELEFTAEAVDAEG